MPSRKSQRWTSVAVSSLLLTIIIAAAALVYANLDLAARTPPPITVPGLDYLFWLVIGLTAFSTMLTWAALRQREKKALAEAVEDPAETLRHRVERANAALTEAVTLMNDLQREVASQTTKLLQTTEQADELAKFLEIHQEHAEFLRQLAVRNTKTAIRAERREQWKFVLIGAGISIPIGIAINLLF